jgi:hypothetical protein
LACATRPISSIRAWFAFRASAVKRGFEVRKSPLVNVVFSSIVPVRNPRPSGPERDEADSELGERGHHLVLGLAPPDRILALQRRDGLHGVGAADRARARLGKAEVSDLAFSDQVPDGPRHVLDRHGRVDAVLVEQVDPVGAEALERSFGDLPDVRGTAVETGLRAVRVDPESELGGDRHLVAHGRQALADELLVDERAVDLGGVEQRHAEIHAARMTPIMSDSSPAGP